MNRRAFVTSVGAILAAPLGAEAQQAGKVYRIGYLTGGSADTSAPLVEGFREGLRELGYTEGRNIIIEYRWAESKPERLRELAADLVGRAQLLQFAVDSRRAPERIGLSHSYDEGPDLAAYARASHHRASGESGPVLAEAAALPPQDGVG